MKTIRGVQGGPDDYASPCECECCRTAWDMECLAEDVSMAMPTDVARLSELARRANVLCGRVAKLDKTKERALAIDNLADVGASAAFALVGHLEEVLTKQTASEIRRVAGSVGCGRYSGE